MANAEITLKVQVVLHAQALKHSTCAVPRNTTGSWKVSRSLSKCRRAYGLNRLQRQDLSQRMCSPTAPGRALQKITIAAAFPSLGAMGKTHRSQISYHPLNKALEVADSSQMNSTLELCSGVTTFLGWSISLYLGACIWVYLMQPNFLLQSRLSIFSLACVLTRLS